MSLNQKYISKLELIDVLKSWRFGTQPASIQYITTPRLNKLGKELFGSIIKISNVGCLIGYSYQSSMNKILNKNVQNNVLTKNDFNKGILYKDDLIRNSYEGTFYNEFDEKISLHNNPLNDLPYKDDLKKNLFVSGFIWNGKGKRINSCLIQHIETLNYYLSFKHQQTFKSFYLSHDLTPVKESIIKNYLYGSDIKKEIEHREISIDNIKKLKFKKVTYVIK
jgi:hypothetical protein